MLKFLFLIIFHVVTKIRVTSVTEFKKPINKGEKRYTLNCYMSVTFNKKVLRKGNYEKVRKYTRNCK